MATGINDNVPVGKGRSYGASALALHLPVVVILAGYAAFYAVLAATGRGDGALAELCLFVIGIGVPFLFAHAALRQVTIRLQPMRHALFVHRGFPAASPREIPWSAVRGVRVRRGFAGLFSRAGTVVIDLADGGTAAVADLARPDAACADIASMIHAEEADAISAMAGTPALRGDAAPLRMAVR